MRRCAAVFIGLFHCVLVERVKGFLGEQPVSNRAGFEPRWGWRLLSLPLPRPALLLTQPLALQASPNAGVPIHLREAALPAAHLRPEDG